MVTALAALDVAVPSARGSAVTRVPGVAAVPRAAGLAVTDVPDVAELTTAEQADAAAKATAPVIAHAVVRTLSSHADQLIHAEPLIPAALLIPAAPQR